MNELIQSIQEIVPPSLETKKNPKMLIRCSYFYYSGSVGIF